jgi:hypothetical protein
MKYLILVIIALGVLSAETSAQDKTPIINKKEVKQEKRIKEGVKTGQLTKGDAKYIQQ